MTETADIHPAARAVLEAAASPGAIVRHGRATVVKQGRMYHLAGNGLCHATRSMSKAADMLAVAA